MTQNTSTLRDLMDAQTVRAIYLSIIARHDYIMNLYSPDKAEIYPGELEVRTDTRQKALSDIIHLTQEMGWDFEELINY